MNRHFRQPFVLAPLALLAGCLGAPMPSPVKPAVDAAVKDITPVAGDSGNTPVAGDSGGNTVVEGAPVIEDAAVRTESCVNLGSLSLTNANALVGQNGTTIWNRIAAAGTLEALGPGTHVVWAFDMNAERMRVGQTFYLEDDPANRSFGTASVIVGVGVGWAGSGSIFNARRIFMSVGGAVRFDAIAAAPGQRFQGSFTQVILREVRFDAASFRSEVVDGGACATINLFSFEGVAQASAPTATDGGTPGAEACAAQTTCEGCTPLAGCGWCAASNRCVAGTATGSRDGACTGANWSWVTAACPAWEARCAALASCGACTPIEGCGWCANLGRCVAGVPDGPARGQCAGGDWRWVPQSCAPGFDAGVRDSGPPDTGIRDSGPPDTGIRDSGPPDTGSSSGGLGGSGMGGLNGTGFRQMGGSEYTACVTGGSACTTGFTCVTGVGRSSGACSRTCTSSADCPAGGNCIAFGPLPSLRYCLGACGATACETSLVCRASRDVSGRSVSVCLPSYW